MNLIQGSQEWLEARKSFITSTDAAVIMGLSPFKTPYKLWRQKMDLDPPEKENDAMRRGTELEPLARQWLLDNEYIDCEPEVMTKDFMMASLDGMSICGNFIVEIKCGVKSFDQAKNGEIPDYYLCQMQHQLYVCNLDLCVYACYNGDRCIVIEVKRDQEFINKMIEKEREFYECLLQFTPPMMTTRDYQMRSDQSWIDAAEKYQQAYKNLKNAESIEQELRNELIALAGSQSSQGAGIKLSKVPRKGAVNYSIIPNLQGVDLDAYRKPTSEYWRLSVE